VVSFSTKLIAKVKKEEGRRKKEEGKKKKNVINKVSNSFICTTLEIIYIVVALACNKPRSRKLGSGLNLINVQKDSQFGSRSEFTQPALLVYSAFCTLNAIALSSFLNEAF
jgi:hypothetical protein